MKFALFVIPLYNRTNKGIKLYGTAILVPFGDVIVADGLLEAYATAFGKGIREEFKQIYKDAKEGGTIIKTLLAGAPSAG